MSALNEHRGIRKALLSLGLAPKGGNYARAKKLAENHGIDLFTPSGTDCAHSKLTRENLAQIHLWRDEQNRTFLWMAQQLGVSRRTVESAYKGLTYKDWRTVSGSNRGHRG